MGTLTLSLCSVTCPHGRRYDREQVNCTRCFEDAKKLIEASIKEKS